MCRCQITSTAVNLDIEIHPSADFITCLLPALFAALPVFLDSFMSCLTTGGQPGTFNPGTRQRCN